MTIILHSVQWKFRYFLGPHVIQRISNAIDLLSLGIEADEMITCKMSFSARKYESRATRKAPTSKLIESRLLVKAKHEYIHQSIMRSYYLQMLGVAGVGPYQMSRL